MSYSPIPGKCFSVQFATACFFAATFVSGCDFLQGPRDAELRVAIAVDRNLSKAAKVIANRLESRHREMAVAVSLFPIDSDLPERAENIQKIIAAQPQLVIAADNVAVAAIVSAGYKGRAMFFTHLPLDSPEIARIVAAASPPAVLGMHFDIHRSCIAWLRELSGKDARVGIISHPLRRDETLSARFAKETIASGNLTVFEVTTIDEAIKLLRRSANLNIDAWYALHSPAVWREPTVLTEAAVSAGRPLAMEHSHYYAEVGSLIGCAIDQDLVGTAAHAARLLLSGANPGELTTSIASSMAISINLQTAQRLKIEVPMSLAMRADKLFPATRISSGGH